MSTKNKSLFICLTPLQTLIAKKIIEKHQLSYDILCLSYNENEKFNYYFHLIGEKSDHFYRYVVKSVSKFGRFVELLKFKKFIKNNLKKNTYENVFFASVDNIFCHLVLSLIGKTNIYTFDDGTANIFKGSIFFKNKESSQLQVLISKVVGNSYDLQIVKSETKLHYTIYPMMDNIVKNTQALSIFDNSTHVSDKVIKIYLGQPLENFNMKDTSKIFEYLKSKSISNYFPHPREIKKEEGFHYLETPLIFEDYIILLLKDGYFVEIYTVLSSVALNLVNTKNVKAFILLESQLIPHYQDLYNLFHDVGCKIEKI